MKHTSFVGSAILSLMAAATPTLAQTQVSTLEEMRYELSPGDAISIVQTTGESVKGTLLRFGDTDLEIQIASPERSGRRELDLRIPLEVIQRLERPRDPTRNGALLGAGIGAGFALAMFARAVAIDRNEIGEWAPIYLGLGAAFTGVGWLIGRSADAGNSKPHVTYDKNPQKTTRIEAIPLVSRGKGVALRVSF